MPDASLLDGGLLGLKVANAAGELDDVTRKEYVGEVDMLVVRDMKVNEIQKSSKGSSILLPWMGVPG